MPSRFQTYGPYPLPRVDGAVVIDELDAFWDEIEDEVPELGSAIGVYVVAGKDRQGKLIPWYVGQTHSGFRSRSKGHFLQGKLSRKLSEVEPKGEFVFFLIALRTKSGEKFRGRKTKGLPIRIIRALETRLIGSCFAMNPALLNVSQITLNRALQVPGYLNDEISTRNRAAKEFAKLFHR